MAKEKTRLDRIAALASARLNGRLLRNNNGIAKHKGQDGKVHKVRYGLGKGTSDQVGWTPVVVTPDMVGRTVAVFTAVEEKSANDQLKQNQCDFLSLVEASGGIAVLCRQPEDLLRAVEKWKGG